MPKYRKALAKAEQKTLPELFDKLKQAHGMAAGWMKFELAPLTASIDGLEELEKKLKKRIFNVEVYAGLTEDLKLINEGAARADEASGRRQPSHLVPPQGEAPCLKPSSRCPSPSCSSA